MNGHTFDLGGNPEYMKRTNPLGFYCLMLLTLAAIALPTPASAQSQSAPSQGTTSGDQDVTRRELANMDRFLDSHPEIAEQLRKDPSLVDNKEFVQSHPEFQKFLADHPGVREQFKEHPDAFMRDEERFDRRDNDVTRRELANMDRFLDSHPEIAEQLRKDPSLVDNKEFVQSHPALQQFLADHPGVREEFKENPNAFMRDEERFDRHQDNDVTRAELATMGRFLDSHPEIAEQLRKDPSLVDNKEFMQSHPALQQFLAEHPEVREQYKENPNAFMRDEERFDRREDRGRGSNVTRGEMASFNEFLEGHGNIAGELSKNPALANNQEYLENHPELKDYLQTHPQVHEELSANPQAFLQSAEQFSTHSTAKVTSESKPK
jgi:hypothetical protein